MLTLSLFNSLRKLLITFVLGWLYMMIAEHLTIGYSNMTEEMVVLNDKFSGTYSLVFWSMTVLVFFVPLLIFYYLISPLIIRAMRYLGWWVIALIGLAILGMAVGVMATGRCPASGPGWCRACMRSPSRRSVRTFWCSPPRSC